MFVELLVFLISKCIFIASFNGSNDLYFHKDVSDNHCYKLSFVPAFCGVEKDSDSALVRTALGVFVEKAVETYINLDGITV